MSIFIINIIFLFFWKFISKYFVKYDRNKFFCVAVTIQFIILFALRQWDFGGNNMRSDLLLYERHYEAVKTLSLREAVVYNGGKSALYYLICAVFAKIGIPFDWFVCILSTLFFVGIGRHIYKFSSEPLMSFVVFLGTGAFTASFFLLRQVLAIFFALLAYSNCANKNRIKTIVYTVIAILIHSSAIIIIPFLIVSNKRFSKLLISFYCMVLVCAVLFRVQIARLIVLIFEQGYIGYYDSKLSVGGNAIMCLLIAVMYLLFNFYSLTRNSNIESLDYFENRQNQMICHGLIILCIIQLCASFSFAFTRLNYYFFSMVLTLAVPECVNVSKMKDIIPRLYPLVAFIVNIILISGMVWLHFTSLAAEGITGIISIFG